MAKAFSSVNGSKLGYFVKSPLGYRDASNANIMLRGLAVGVGTLTGRLIRHIIAPKGSGTVGPPINGNGYGLWTQQYTSGVPGAVSLGVSNQPQGSVNTTTTPQRIRRTILLYVVQPADAAYVGQEVYMTVNVFVGSGSTGLNIFTSVPALPSSFANAGSGTLVATLAPVNGIVTVDLGFKLPAVGSSFSIGAALVNDLSLINSPGINEQTTGNGIAGGSFYTLG